ncbi:MAG: phosphoribosylformylglycinamidine synthase subunit PurL [Phycisphaerae bacterium]|nr:phosphoribosylformylglycinamidine synthase subunit PurL [Phycisphaerae bacterium]
MIYRIEIVPKGESDPVGAAAGNEIRLLGIDAVKKVSAGRIFLLEADPADLPRPQAERIAADLLADPVVEQFHIGPTRLGARPQKGGPSPFSKQAEEGAGPLLLIEVFYKPGVMDPVALSTQQAIADMGLKVASIRTGRIYQITTAKKLSDAQIRTISGKVLANECIEQAIVGSAGEAAPPHAPSHEFKLRHIDIRGLNDEQLVELSARGHLFLNVTEMQTIQAYFRKIGREPTDIELETLAQTWSEHCVHKTLKSRVDFSGPDGHRTYENLLADTIAAATKKLNKPWCISVFKDNAGVIEFDDTHAVCFKVETHNHPSALDPYGGAATGIGGCIRDPMGTGMGAKPVANTDIFCFAPPDTPASDVPKGVLHPRRVMRGVVSGVRDYGNRMGIPTVNGAIFFDDRYLGNPLVFCGNVGLMDRGKCFKHQQAGDAIVVVGGRTGRDGIHGATFSSGELTHTHEDEFSHAVQIGNAITEKKMADVLDQARDRDLYNAITDCGAGGLSSAVGEMGEELGATVNLETVPLKYAGLSYTEIWISEAQERMVLAAPQAKVKELLALFASEDVEATVIGTFTGDKKLKLFYKDEAVGEIEMKFLHDGLPKYVRKAEWKPDFGLRIADCGLKDQKVAAVQSEIRNPESEMDYSEALLRLLGHYNIASKEWVVRQYDHEVQGGSAVKPLVGVANDGPGDGAVFTPVLGSRKGVALACGLSPRLGDLDPYQMALHAIDECVRNLVCVGADFGRIAILDNFCWGNCSKPDRFGSLVLAAQACHDGALAYGTPFISGKDSLNNEFVTDDGRVITIPPTLLISGIAIVPDVTGCLTMDAKAAGNVLVVVGETQAALAGSHYELTDGGTGRRGDGETTKVDLAVGPQTARAVADAIAKKLVRSAHDVSEGGLAVAISEMAFAGGLGVDADLAKAPAQSATPESILFGESPSRYLLEVEPGKLADLDKALAGIPHAVVGAFTATGRVELKLAGKPAIAAGSAELKQAWQSPLNWK